MRLRFLAFAVLASGQGTSSLGQSVIQVPERPKIIVEGHGEVKTPPDVAIIRYTIRGEGTTSDHAVRAMTEAGTRIDSSIRSIDASAQPETGSVRVTPVKSDACKEDEDNSPQLSTGPCAVLGYVATQSVTIRTALVKDSGTMVGLVGRGGALDAHIDRFDLRDPRPAQQQATTAALVDAASKAATIAAASRIVIGRILSISTGEREGGQAIIVTGTVRPARAFAPPPVPVTLTPEPITTSADVTVTYAIAQ